MGKKLANLDKIWRVDLNERDKDFVIEQLKRDQEGITEDT